ncbi:MAG: retropepsin-like aspartic protease [Candidatus Omnitrophota bacterium]|jgi:predicted aspartyl protease
MCLKNIPFTKVCPQDAPRPWLFIDIINPRAGKKIRFLGLIDTGAHDCTLPADYASLLGFELKAGARKKIITGNGAATAYSHEAAIEVGDYRIRNVLVDFVPHLNVVLLGTNGFLTRFVLTVDYPRKVFSLRLSK